MARYSVTLTYEVTNIVEVDDEDDGSKEWERATALLAEEYINSAQLELTDWSVHKTREGDTREAVNT